jgi:uncharacterized protein YeaO (DUF488 family)
VQAPEDGVRILVDRLWPRGISKQRAAINQWMKDISPSTKKACLFEELCRALFLTVR